MRRLALIAAVLALLVLPAVGQAKGLKWVEVCGQEECSKTSGKNWDYERRPLIFPPTVMSGMPDDPPTAPAPWFRVKVAFAHAHGHRARSLVAPEIKYAGGKDGSYGYVWEKLKPKPLRTYLRLSKGLAPNPAETMPGGEERTADALQSALQVTASAVAIFT
jgi:hypothetical protein